MSRSTSNKSNKLSNANIALTNNQASCTIGTDYNENEHDINNDSTHKKKLSFCYRLLKPEENSDIEYQFEELRAKQYYKIYEKRSSKEIQMENEIMILKKQLAEKEAKLKQFENEKLEKESLKDLTNKNDNYNINSIMKNKINNKNKNFDVTVDHKTTDFTRDNNFTNVSLMSTFTKAYDKKGYDEDETQDYSTTNWLSNMTKSTNVMNNSAFPTSRTNVTMHTKMARQDVNALFGSCSTDTTTNTTMPTTNYDGKSIAIHNDFDNISSNGKDDHFSIFHDPTQNLTYKENNLNKIESNIKNKNEDYSMLAYENHVDNQQRKSIQPSILKNRRPLNFIEETESKIAKTIDDDERENDSDTPNETKFSGLNEQYTAKLCFNPSAMSTVSIKPFLDQIKKVKFNAEADKIEEISSYEDSVIIDKNSDHLSKIMEEDFKTEYGWSKLMDNNKQNQNQQKDVVNNNTNNNNNNGNINKKKILKSSTNFNENEISYERGLTTTTNLSQVISWDYYKMDVEGNDQSELQSPPSQQQQPQSEFTAFFNRPLEFNTQKIPTTIQQEQTIENNETVNDETLTNINEDKYRMKTNNYQICHNISSVNTTVNASTSKCIVEKSHIIEHHISEFKERSHLTFVNQSKLIPPSNISVNNLTLGEPELPPDFTIMKDKTNIDKTNISKQLEKDIESIRDENKINTEDEDEDEDEYDESNDEEIEEKNSFEMLTKEKLEETMTTNFRKCYKVIAAATEGLNITVNNVQSSNESRLIQDDLDIGTKTLPHIWKFLKDFSVNKNQNEDVTTSGYTNNFTTTFKTTQLLNIDENSNESERSPANDTIHFAIQDPFNYELKNRLLARHQDVLNNHNGYLCVDVNLPPINQNRVIAFGGESFKINKEVGSGAYAKIYTMTSLKNNEKRIALKVSKQPTAWEYYVTETLHERLKNMKKNIAVESSFIKITKFIKHENGILCSMNYYKNGTLLDFINYHIKFNINVPYWFSLYLTLEMLNILNYLHKAKIIHGDIKADNLMINLLPNSINYFDPSKTKCLVLIDFNRSIDLEMFPDETEFDAKANNKSLLCCEMKADKPWTYQVDYFGILQSIHCIIFKKYMSLYQETERNRITQSFPRNFDRLHQKLFDTFLNIPSSKEIPNLEIDWIPQFVTLFRNELALNFSKSEKYLSDLNAFYNQK